MRPKSKLGYTLLEIAMIVLLIALLALIVIPGIGRMRDRAQRARCLDNLRQLNSASQQYIVENSVTVPPPLALLTPYFQTLQLPTCPASGEYRPAPSIGRPPTCSHAEELDHKLD